MYNKESIYRQWHREYCRERETETLTTYGIENMVRNSWNTAIDKAIEEDKNFKSNVTLINKLELLKEK